LSKIAREGGGRRRRMMKKRLFLFAKIVGIESPAETPREVGQVFSFDEIIRLN